MNEGVSHGPIQASAFQRESTVIPRSKQIIRLLFQAGSLKEGPDGKSVPHVYEISGAEVYYHPGLRFISVYVPERYSEQRKLLPHMSATAIIEDVHQTAISLSKQPPIERRI